MKIILIFVLLLSFTACVEGGTGYPTLSEFDPYRVEDSLEMIEPNDVEDAVTDLSQDTCIVLQDESDFWFRKNKWTVLNDEDLVQVEGIEIFMYFGTETEVVIPAEINGIPVLGIGEFLFADSSEITSIIIPDTVVWIGQGAFYGCSGLTSIEIPHGVTHIAPMTFGECHNLAEVKLPDNLLTITSNAFLNCISLQHIIIPDNVIFFDIDIGAFTGCENLTSAVYKGKTYNVVLWENELGDEWYDLPLDLYEAGYY